MSICYTIKAVGACGDRHRNIFSRGQCNLLRGRCNLLRENEICCCSGSCRFLFFSYWCTIVYQDLLCKRNCVKVFEFRSYLLTQENQNQINCRTYDKTDIRGTSQDYQFMLVSFLWITQTSLLLKDAS